MQKEEPENGKDFSFSPKKEKSLLELMPTSSDVTLNTPESTPTPSERMTASSTVRAPS